MSERPNQRRYVARAGRDFKFNQAGTGTDQVVVSFAIVGGERDGDRLTGYFPLTDASVDYTFDKLRGAGWDGRDIVALDGLGSVDCSIVVEEEEGSDGKLYEKIVFVNTLGVKVKNEISGAGLQDFAARMRGHLQDYQRRNGIAGGGAPQQRQQPRQQGNGGQRFNNNAPGFNGPPPDDGDRF